MPGSKLFQQNRALGHVCNHLPATIRFIKHRNDNVIVTSVGRVYHVYSANHFRLICVSDSHVEEISALSSDTRYVYTAAGSEVFVWHSGHVVKTLIEEGGAKVHLLLPFGNFHLISIDANSLVRIWNIAEETKFAEIPFNNNEFEITAICHPLTYLNKVLIGSRQGSLQLWNIKEAKLVYTFQKFESKISILESGPAIDIVAVGLVDGTVAILNLKFDKIVMQFKQDWGPVTSISFRTDGQPLMTTGSTNGQIVVWNLEERVVHSQFTAHSGTIASAVFLPNEPLLFTSSHDNSIKLWIFDSVDGKGRLLRIREGHSAPPMCIRCKYCVDEIILKMKCE